MADVSLVEFLGDSADICGYCKAASKSSYGLWAHQLTVVDYQALLDRGWRRSGKYCYKPNLREACCCLYTIRCEVDQSTLSKSQRRVLKRMNDFLLTGQKRKFCKSDFRPEAETCKEANVEKTLPLNFAVSKKQEKCFIDEMPRKIFIQPAADTQPRDNGNDIDPSLSEKRLRKAKYKRRQRKIERLIAKGLPPILEKRDCRPKSIESFLSQINNAQHLQHKLTVRLVRSCPPDALFEKTYLEAFEVYKKYQVAIHSDDEKKVTEKSYKRFLCDSPLIQQSFPQIVNLTGFDMPCAAAGFGSYHMQYLLDDKIIAVGVVDILSSCVSSKYFFYSPETEFLHLGIYSALREVSLVRQLHVFLPDIKYYYMGYYLHNNRKMRYKGQYSPSYLLCPEAFTWHPIELCRPLLDCNKYCRLEPQKDKADMDGDVNLKRVIVLYRGVRMFYKAYKLKKKAFDQNEDLEVEEYARWVGKHCAYSLCLVRC